MTWARLCEHGEVHGHYRHGDSSAVHCRGGFVLPADVLVILREDAEPVVASMIARYHMTVGDAVEAAVRILDALASAQGSQE